MEQNAATAPDYDQTEDDTFDRKSFVENSCISLMACLRRSDEKPATADDDFEETVSFIEIINYVAENPVMLWNGREIVKLSPGEAAYKILTDPNCEITMIRPGSKTDKLVAGKPP